MVEKYKVLVYNVQKSENQQIVAYIYEKEIIANSFEEAKNIINEGMKNYTNKAYSIVIEYF